MGDFIMKLTSPEAIVYVTPVVLLILYILYKDWPELKQRISAGPLKEKQMQDTDESLAGEIRKMCSELQEFKESVNGEIREIRADMLGMKDKLANDYSRINLLEWNADHMRKLAESSMEERQILMECSLAMLKGIRELGAKEWGNDGPPSIKKAEDDLQDYLTGRAHRIG